MQCLLWQLAFLATVYAYPCDHDAYKELSLDKLDHGLVHSTRMLYPVAPGSYPVLTWLHGWQLEGASYDEILCDSAKSNIIICPQMDRNFAGEQLDKDSKLLMPYLYDTEKGILTKISSSKILPGYGYTHVGLGGHSRGGGVIAYAYSHGIVSDASFSSLIFVDPVTASNSDVPNTVTLNRTKVRSMYFNDAKSSCVVNGWPQFGDKFVCRDLKVTNAGPAGCQHMDVVSGPISWLPICHSNSTIEEMCKGLARHEIASAGFGPASGSVLV